MASISARHMPLQSEHPMHCDWLSATSLARAMVRGACAIFLSIRIVISPRDTTAPKEPSRRFGLRHVEFDVFKVTGLVVDAHFGRGDPAGEFTGFVAGFHQGLDKVAICLGW